jgi:carboxypeptidase C (cathepsin A)/GH25 family lysozyme M1 (1,4-beta-N-acetylmuramidase)/subtilisin family serine protease
MGPDLFELFEDGNGDDEVAAIIRLGRSSVLPKGVRVVTQFGEIITIRTSRSNIPTLSGSAEVADIAAGDTYLGPDVEIEAADFAEISSDTVLPSDERRPSEEKATGRGVVVGSVDWGFDFAHPDFLNEDGTTRILALWDQRGSRLPNSPQPFGYGVVHDRNEINRALKQKDPYAALGYHPADADTGIGCHGTHVLSIAAGGGGENRPTGIAPEADLVLVHNAPWDEVDTGRLGDSVTLLEGIDFIARIAGDRPWVINLSMGRHGEQHDGSTLIEQGLDAAIRSAPGRAVSMSAGNYFDKRIHASGQLRPTQERTIVWEILENKPTNNQLEFWYSWQDKFEVTVHSPDGSIAARAAIGERSKFVVGGKEVGNLYHRGQEPNNLDNHITIYLYKEAPAGEWEVTLIGSDVIDGRYHAWIERDVSCGSCQSRLRPDDADPRCTTGTICNGRRTLAVGAYNKHDPEMRLGHFSSVGPTRDGRLKPDLCAPGVSVLAARSAPREKREPVQLLTRMSGTSMASPHCTGTIALMFQAAPRRLRIEETHNLLLQSAQKVSVPEDIPERIGIGFLDIEAAVDGARKIHATSSSFKQTTVQSPAATPKPNGRPADSENVATSESHAEHELFEGRAEEEYESSETAAYQNTFHRIASDITGAFEGGKTGTLNLYDLGIISYGKHQATLHSGTLFGILQRFTELSSSPLAMKMAAYLDRVKQRDESLREDTEFIRLLKDAATEPQMDQAQDEEFGRQYWEPAKSKAAKAKVKTALGHAIFYDTKIQGGLDQVAKATETKLGGTIGQSVNGKEISEQDSLRAFVEERMQRNLRISTNQKKQAATLNSTAQDLEAAAAAADDAARSDDLKKQAAEKRKKAKQYAANAAALEVSSTKTRGPSFAALVESGDLDLLDGTEAKIYLKGKPGVAIESLKQGATIDATPAAETESIAPQEELHPRECSCGSEQTSREAVVREEVLSSLAAGSDVRRIAGEESEAIPLESMAEDISQGQGCSAVVVDCITPSRADLKLIRPKGSPEGSCKDRTEGDRSVNLALQLTDYDINAYQPLKAKHNAAVLQVRDFIVKRTLQSDERIAVTITGSASRTGGKDYNDALSCKRANCVAQFLRFQLDRFKGVLERVDINPSGEGFTRATCDGKDCEQDVWRSVLIQVHAPNNPPPPIPVDPGWDKYLIRCCSFGSESLSSAILGDLLKKGLPQIPEWARGKVQELIRSQINELVKRLLKNLPKLDSLVQDLGEFMELFPGEVIREKGAFEIRERAKDNPRSIILCYSGWGLKITFPRGNVEDLIDQVPGLSHLPDALKKLIKAGIKEAIPDSLKTLIQPIESRTTGQFVPFDLLHSRSIKVFEGSAQIGEGFWMPGTVNVQFSSAPWTRPDLQERPSITNCSGCTASGIQVVVGAGHGMELFAVTGGDLVAGSCECDASVSTPSQSESEVREDAEAGRARLVELADEIVNNLEGGEAPVYVLHEMFARSENLEALPTVDGSVPPTAAQIFDTFVYADSSRLGERLSGNFEVVALPRESLDEVCAGDVMVRRGDGNSAHVSIVASPGAMTLEGLAAEGLTPESPVPGKYVHVVDGGAFPHESEDKYARQLTDSAGRLLNDVLLLRMATPPPPPTVINLQQSSGQPSEPGSDPGDTESLQSWEQESGGDLLPSFPAGLADAVRGGVIKLEIAVAIMSGQRDVDQLTNAVFYSRHPEFAVGQKIQPQDHRSAQEWLQIRDQVVRPLLQIVSAVTRGGTAAAGTTGTQAGQPIQGSNAPLILGLDTASVDENGDADWAKAKTEGPISFAIIRAHTGWQRDAMFARDWSKIKQAGIVRGAYLFLTFPTPRYPHVPDPALQAQGFIDVVGDLEESDFPPTLDVEFPGGAILTHMTPQQLLDGVRAAWRVLKGRYRVAPLIYTSARVWREDLLDPDAPDLLESALWLTRYPFREKQPAIRDAAALASGGAFIPPNIPKPWGAGNWWIHQYQGDARELPGFRQVDMNRFNPMAKDVTGERVKWVQRRLGIAQSGAFDSTMEAALKAFQIKKSLSADGVIDHRTFTFLCWSNPDVLKSSGGPGTASGSSKESFSVSSWDESYDETDRAALSDNDDHFDMAEVPPVVTHHQITLNDNALKYTATTGRLPIKRGDGETEAQMFFVAYTLDGQDTAKRPVTFAFNGGPGSASLWLHVGALGPRKVVLQPEGFLPPAPYRIENNPYTLLDKSDLVLIDAIGTGFSRASDSETFARFWGVKGDIEAFSEFIRLYITRNERWGSPLFLLGESYGTMRAAGIVGYLSEKGISFNGITLLSTVLNYETLEATKTNDLPYVFLIPTFTMIAGYHHKLPPDLAQDMNRARQQAEKWAAGEYAQALSKGDGLTPAERRKVIEQMSRFTGLDKQVLDDANLRIDVAKFTHYLLLDRKLRVGRFDGRFTGTDPEGLLDTQSYDPTASSTHPPFTSVFNNYVRSELGYKTDMPYYTHGQEAMSLPWNWGSAIEGFPDTATSIRQAIVKNPYLKILVMEGYFDLATPYSAANYTIDHLDLPQRYRSNISFATYGAGHMVYLPEAGLKKMKDDQANFMAQSLDTRASASPKFTRAVAPRLSEDDPSVLATATREMSLQDIADGKLGNLPADVLAKILTRGESDANRLTTEVFWQLHPELAGKALDANDRSQQMLRAEWSVIFRRRVKPIIWLRALITLLDKFRGTIPREFLLGWIAWESDGYLASPATPLGELGYFQIMWQGEAKDQLRIPQEEFQKLKTDPEFSIEKGVALAEIYRQYILKTYPSIADGSDLLWRLTKGRHTASGILKSVLGKLEKAATPITWASVSSVLPGWMLENIGNTMNYAAKLKSIADLVPAAPGPVPGAEFLSAAEDDRDLAPFRAILSDAKESLARELAEGDFQPFFIAAQRDAFEVMERQLLSFPENALSFNMQKVPGRTPAQLWYKYMLEQAMAARDASLRDPAAFRIKMDEYFNLGNDMVGHIAELIAWGKQYRTDDEIYTVRESKQTGDVVMAIALALQQSANFHRYDYDFLDVSAKNALQRMLREERPDLSVALRISSSVPGDISVTPLPRAEQRPAYVTLIETAISFVPLVGNAVMAYESVAGRDLFGYKLSDVERGILGASVLLPMMGRFIEADRAIYSAERMARLYGGEAESWSHTLALSERVSAEPNAFSRLRAAERAVAAGERLTPKTAGEFADMLLAIDIAKAGKGVPTVLSRRSVLAFDTLVQHSGRWAELDANAIERISRLKVGSHVQGQLLEELLGNRMAVWLNDPAGKAALDLEAYRGRLEFIPGHLIRDLKGRQLTDGMIIRKLNDGTYRIAAVCEAKAGEFAARGLSLKSVEIAKLSKADREMLTAEAEETLQFLQERARRTGQPVSVSLDDIMKEIAQEHGGQIRQDIERLSPSLSNNPNDDTDVLAPVLIGGEEVRVRFSPKFVKFFGVLPSDVKATDIAKQLLDAGIKNFVSLGLNVTQDELRSAAEVVKTMLSMK